MWLGKKKVIWNLKFSTFISHFFCVYSSYVYAQRKVMRELGWSRVLSRFKIQIASMMEFVVCCADHTERPRISLSCALSNPPQIHVSRFTSLSLNQAEWRGFCGFQSNFVKVFFSAFQFCKKKHITSSRKSDKIIHSAELCGICTFPSRRQCEMSISEMK